MEVRLAAERSQGAARGTDRGEQALRFLESVLGKVDFSAAAGRCGGEWASGPPEAIRLRFLDSLYCVTRGGVTALEGGPSPVWVKIFLLIYVTRATGDPSSGEWIAYRQLPNTMSKAKSFEATADRVAEVFDRDPPGLDGAALGLGGEAVSFGSADRAYRFRVLPRVELLLLFWQGGEEFPARSSVLVDRDVLGYLDQEAIVFLAEAFVNRLLGRGLDAIVP